MSSRVRTALIVALVVAAIAGSFMAGSMLQAQRVEAVEDSVAEVAAVAQRVDSQLTQLAGDSEGEQLADLAKTLDDLKASISSISKDLDALKGTSAKLDALTSKVNSISAKLDGLEDRLWVLETRYNDHLKVSHNQGS